MCVTDGITFSMSTAVEKLHEFVTTSEVPYDISDFCRQTQKRRIYSVAFDAVAMLVFMPIS